LGVGYEQFETWSKPTGIIQTGREQTDDAFLETFPTSESGTTLGTKAAFVMSTGQTGRSKMLNRAFGDSKRANGHNYGRRIRAAACPLAIAAMALRHEQGLGGAFVTHGAADAAAGNWKSHNAPNAWLIGADNGAPPRHKGFIYRME
jgi:hypothetical protein